MWSSIASDSYIATTLCYVGVINGKISLQLKKTMAPATSGHAADEARENLRYRRRRSSDVACVVSCVVLSVVLSVIYLTIADLNLIITSRSMDLLLYFSITLH